MGVILWRFESSPRHQSKNKKVYTTSSVKTKTPSIIGISLLFLSACATVVPPAQSPQASSSSSSPAPSRSSLPTSAPAFDPLTDAKKKELPWSVRIPVPFTVQAPHADWSPTFEEACEEAALLMVERHLQGGAPFTPETARDEILDLIQWESAKGYDVDITLDELAALARERFGRRAAVYHDDDVTIESIQYLLASGYPVIVPAQGQMLGNPYFSGEGPPYHMLVITGYTPLGSFITNDPGTKRGEGYTYKQHVLMNAIHDWTGKKETVHLGRTSILVIGA